MFYFEIEVQERKRRANHTRKNKKGTQTTVYKYTNRMPLNPQKKLRSNLFKLSIATAKAYLTQNLSYKHRLEAIGTMFKVLSVCQTINKKLYSTSILDDLKDFSKTSRIGEIGQGITYMVIQKIYGYPIINDCKIFASTQGIQISGKTPDFIASKGKLNNRFILVESKSGWDMSEKLEKSNMTQALEQLANAEQAFNNSSKKINISNSYAVCSSIAPISKKPQQNSFISYIDPVGEEINDGNFEKIALNHYAKFFILAGMHEESEMLISGINLNIEKFKNKSNMHKGYYIVNDNGIFKSLLSESAVNFICGVSKELPCEPELVDEKFDIARFTDGTLFDANKEYLLKTIKN